MMTLKIILASLMAFSTLFSLSIAQDYVEAFALPSGLDSDAPYSELECVDGANNYGYGDSCYDDVVTSVYNALVNMIESPNLLEPGPGGPATSLYTPVGQVVISIYWRTDNTENAQGFVNNAGNGYLDEVAGDLAPYIVEAFQNNNAIEICALFYSNYGWWGPTVVAAGWNEQAYQMSQDEANTKLAACEAP